MKEMNELQIKYPEQMLTLLDIGANVGWFTLALASRGYHVIAFEPFCENRKALKHSIC